MNVGDVMVMELGVFADNSTFTRLVNVKVVELSFDAKHAAVVMLPPDPNKKNTIHAEHRFSNKFRIVESHHLFRDPQHYKDSCAFKVGDIVCGYNYYTGEKMISTVIRVMKTALEVVDSGGMTHTVSQGNMIVISRRSNDDDPGVTESQG